MAFPFKKFEYRGYEVEYHPPYMGLSTVNVRISRLSGDVPFTVRRTVQTIEDAKQEIDFILDVERRTIQAREWLAFMTVDQQTWRISNAQVNPYVSHFATHHYAPDIHGQMWTAA